MDQNPRRTMLRPLLGGSERASGGGHRRGPSRRVVSLLVGGCGEELVGLSGGFGEVSAVGVEVALGGLD